MAIAAVVLNLPAAECCCRVTDAVTFLCWQRASMPDLSLLCHRQSGSTVGHTNVCHTGGPELLRVLVIAGDCCCVLACLYKVYMLGLLGMCLICMWVCCL